MYERFGQNHTAWVQTRSDKRVSPHAHQKAGVENIDGNKCWGRCGGENRASCRWGDKLACPTRKTQVKSPPPSVVAAHPQKRACEVPQRHRGLRAAPFTPQVSVCHQETNLGCPPMHRKARGMLRVHLQAPGGWRQLTRSTRMGPLCGGGQDPGGLQEAGEGPSGSCQGQAAGELPGAGCSAVTRVADIGMSMPQHSEGRGLSRGPDAPSTGPEPSPRGRYPQPRVHVYSG